MPPKKASSRKAATKTVAVSVDAAKLAKNGEKEIIEELATDAKSLANGSPGPEVKEEVKEEVSKPKSSKRGGRSKNVAADLETETTPPATKKPAASKGRGKKKTNENEVIENEKDAQSDRQEVAEEVKLEEEAKEEAVTKPKGRGGGRKKASKTKEDEKEKQTTENGQEEEKQEELSNDALEEERKVSAKKGKKDKKEEISTENGQEEEQPKDIAEEEEEPKVPAKKTKAVGGRKRKQEVPIKAEEEVLAVEENKEELEKKAPKKSTRTKKTTETPVEPEPLKKRGRGSRKETPSVEIDEVEVIAMINQETATTTKAKDNKPTKRSRAAAKNVANKEEETAATNGETEEMLPKKRSRKAPSVEKEIVTEKPRKGRAKKADKAIEKLKEEPVQGKEEEESGINELENGDVKQEEKEESTSSDKKIEAETEVAVEAPAPAASKAKGGRKRAAPSAKKSAKTSKKSAEDEEQQMDDGVDNTELEDEADETNTKSSKSKKNKTDTSPLNATTTKYNKEDFELPPPADGQNVEEPRFNLKISSWNVAGLRSWLKKEGLKYLEYEQPDIFCMQETKCTTDQLPEEVQRIPGYHPYWLCLPGGYAGVAIYSKIMPINVEYGIGNKEFDDSGRIITAEYEKFFLINVYVPNSGRKLVNLESRMKWEKLFQEFVKKLDSRKPVVICGDMNVSHQEHDLANPKSNTRNAGFTKEERDKMSELLALGYVDTFRHLYPERKGAYTFWTYMGNARSRNVGWRLDYFIVSERFIKRVVDNCIRSQCMGSDHCPITLFMKL